MTNLTGNDQIQQYIKVIQIIITVKPEVLGMIPTLFFENDLTDFKTEQLGYFIPW